MSCKHKIHSFYEAMTRIYEAKGSRAVCMECCLLRKENKNIQMCLHLQKWNIKRIKHKQLSRKGEKFVVGQNESEAVGRVRWLTPVNPSTLGDWVRWIMRSGVQDQPGQDGETLFLLKIQKLAGHVGRRITWTQRAENTVSRDGTTTLQPGWQSNILPQKKRK